MNLNDQLKAKIDEIDVDTQVTRAKDLVEQAVRQVMDFAGGMVHDNRERVDALLDKAATEVDSRTDGKYATKIAKAKASFASGLDKMDAAAAGADSDAEDAGTGWPTTDPYAGESRGAEEPSAHE